MLSSEKSYLLRKGYPERKSYLVRKNQVAPSGGQICNWCKWRHAVAKFSPSLGVNFWVRCASGNVFSSWCFQSRFFWGFCHNSLEVKIFNNNADYQRNYVEVISLLSLKKVCTKLIGNGRWANWTDVNPT